MRKNGVPSQCVTMEYGTRLQRDVIFPLMLIGWIDSTIMVHYIFWVSKISYSQLSMYVINGIMLRHWRLENNTEQRQELNYARNAVEKIENATFRNYCIGESSILMKFPLGIPATTIRLRCVICIGQSPSQQSQLHSTHEITVSKIFKHCIEGRDVSCISVIVAAL